MAEVVSRKWPWGLVHWAFPSAGRSSWNTAGYPVCWGKTRARSSFPELVQAPEDVALWCRPKTAECCQRMYHCARHVTSEPEREVMLLETKPRIRSKDMEHLLGLGQCSSRAPASHGHTLGTGCGGMRAEVGWDPAPLAGGPRHIVHCHCFTQLPP